MFASLPIAVVSPFIDRRHGTERAIAELIECLAARYDCEVHVFAQSVADLRIVEVRAGETTPSGSLYWHRVPQIPGPHLLRFAAWYVLNRIYRGGTQFDLVVSPGINCADADVVIVHALFRRLSELQPADEAGLPGPLRTLHRRAYYRLVGMLESGFTPPGARHWPQFPTARHP